MKKHLKFILLIVSAAAIILAVVFYRQDWRQFKPAAINLQTDQPGGSSINNGQNKVCFNENCFSVELARTNDEQARGLMFRASLAADAGMLFIFSQEGVYSFWMENTLIPLDMIWLDESGRVVYIKENAQPCPANGDCPDINPSQTAKYVLEINAGVSKKIGLRVGDTVKFSF